MYLLYGAHPPFGTYLVSYNVEPIAIYTFSFARRHKYIETHFLIILQQLTVRTYLLTVLSPRGLPYFATGHSTRIIYCIEPTSVCICICNSFSSSSPPLLTVGLRQEGGFSGPGLLRERGEGGRRAQRAMMVMHTTRWDIARADAYGAMGYHREHV
jgi:hypothetical protein